MCGHVGDDGHRLLEGGLAREHQCERSERSDPRIFHDFERTLSANHASEAVSKILEQAKANFPEGMNYKITYDTTKFVTASLELVEHTFIEALVLVLVVVLLINMVIHFVEVASSIL